MPFYLVYDIIQRKHKQKGEQHLKALLYKYRHAWILLYFPIYMMWFSYLERTVTQEYHAVHIGLDDIIPFNEWFVIPYYIWFVYVVAVVAYLFFVDKKEYYRCTAFLFIGMTICLIIYTIWPNGQILRPDLETLGRDNIAIRIIANLYRTDTNTNVCPSIHAFNSIACCIAIFHCSRLSKRTFLKAGSVLLSISICLSTMFLKQHSAFDVLCAFALSIFMYVVVYVPDYSALTAKMKSRSILPKAIDRQ